MGKKQQGKDEAPNPHNIVNKEVFQRLNFLYQASVYLKSLETIRLTSSVNLNAQTGVFELQTPRKRRRACLGDLGSIYVRNMRTIGNKTVVRMDPNVKRTLCKGCDTVLIPGTTASVRVKGHKMVYICLGCRTLRVIPAPPVVSEIAPSSSPPSGLQTTTIEDVPEALVPMPSQSANAGRWKKHKGPTARPLPLFAREDAGHVVFRGNEVLREGQE